MTEVIVIALLFGAGLLVLTAEIFIPSHGLLTVVGVGFLIAAIVRTFMTAGQTAGIIAVLASMVVLPTIMLLAIKFWPRTPIGRRIAPPNPIVRPTDTSIPVAELSSLLGRAGRCVSPLRPVGICDFDGRRVSCVSEMGMIDAGSEVRAVGLSGANLVVEENLA
jgi:membrane-bound ClpP family serine protease